MEYGPQGLDRANASRLRRFTEVKFERHTISCILISWKGLKRQALVCICREPRRPFFLHSLSFWQSEIGRNVFWEISWKVSEPQTSHVYALTCNSGLTSDTRVTIPRTVINRPNRTPFTSLTAIGRSVARGLKYRLLHNI